MQFIQSWNNCSRQTSLLPLDVLIFVTLRVVSLKPCFRNIDNHATYSVHIIDLCEVLCCIEIFVGKFRPTIVIKIYSKICKHDHGCLCFTWLQIKNHRQQHKIILITEIAHCQGVIFPYLHWETLCTAVHGECCMCMWCGDFMGLWRVVKQY